MCSAENGGLKSALSALSAQAAPDPLFFNGLVCADLCADPMSALMSALELLAVSGRFSASCADCADCADISPTYSRVMVLAFRTFAPRSDRSILIPAVRRRGAIR